MLFYYSEFIIATFRNSYYSYFVDRIFLHLHQINLNFTSTMGKGDKKTKKGKRFMGSYGVLRRRKSAKAVYKPKRKPSTKKKEADEELAAEEVTGSVKKETAKKAKAKPKTKAKAKAKAKTKKAPAKKAATKKAAKKK